jgi:hypothetical protein
MFKKYLPFFFIVFFGFFGCETDDTVDNNEDLYNRSDLLINWADNIIIPSYNSLNHIPHLEYFLQSN